jgi:TetR/AcrR family transcriptional regulator, transcriptional repressor for nem operon
MPKPNVRDQLLSAGLLALHTKGFNATSVQDITDSAGVPKGSFYNHFASKEDFGAAVVRQYSAKGAARRAALKDQSLPPLTRLRRHFEALIESARYPDAPGCLLGNFATELSNQSPAIRENVAEAFDVWTDAVAQVLEEAKRVGELPRDAEPRSLAAFVIDAWEGAVLRSKVEKNRAPVDAFVSIVFSKVLT